ncbi:hypothetical protein ABEF94_008390 [Exophiala dermatitidis]
MRTGILSLSRALSCKPTLLEISGKCKLIGRPVSTSASTTTNSNNSLVVRRNLNIRHSLVPVRSISYSCDHNIPNSKQSTILKISPSHQKPQAPPLRDPQPSPMQEASSAPASSEAVRQQTEPQKDEPSLEFESLNPDATGPTILLIHGAFTTGRDWDLVTPYLTSPSSSSTSPSSNSYHILVPDLPGHGKSRTITPFSVSYSAHLLRQLIVNHAHNGIAHVVGHSLGAHVAIRLASQYPEVVSRLLVSGFEVFPTSTGPSSRLSSLLPYAVWTSQRLENCVPRSVVRWLMDGADIRNIDTSFCTLALCRQICEPMSDNDKWPEPWPSPTLVIAAGKAGVLLPTSDHPHDAKRLADIGKQLCPETKAVTHPKMRHPWNRQDPRLFADTVRAWMENRPLPDGFVDL